MSNKSNVAKVKQITNWSPIWIIPLITAFIGLWILFYHFSHQGPLVTLITMNAEGIEANKTAIKSRSVDVGIVESVSLSDDLNTVIITARLKNEMQMMLKEDSVFWVVKPQIGREGVSGLNTLLSGSYIEIRPGRSKISKDQFTLQDTPPLASGDAKGLRIILESAQAGQLSPGDPILYRGFRVGTVEGSEFDTDSRLMRYKLFITSPYEMLVTTNTRFWLDSGFSFDLSSEGMAFQMSSLQTLISGGISFDVPDGWLAGDAAKNGDKYRLFENKQSTLDSLYTRYDNFLIFFNESIRGLAVGAPVEFRGIRIGTVVQAPYYIPEMWTLNNRQVNIPVLISIEPDRIRSNLGIDVHLKEHMLRAQRHGLRGALKTGNLLTGALFVDFDYYENPEVKNEDISEREEYGYPILATTSVGLSQMQQKLIHIMDKINALPLDSLIEEMDGTLKQSHDAMKNMAITMKTLNNLLASKDAQVLPNEMKKTLHEVNETLKGMQSGSPAYSKIVDDMKRLDDIMRELQPLLRTLNQKSNALVFEADKETDPQPKRAKK